MFGAFSPFWLTLVDKQRLADLLNLSDPAAASFRSAYSSAKTRLTR